MKLHLIIFVFVFIPLISFEQGVISFRKTYGGTGYNNGMNAYQTDDGGYIILGNKSAVSGSTDIYLIKTDTVGKIQWEKTIGGAEVDWANDFKITKDKGFIIAGYTNINFTNGYDVLLIKTDSLGIVQWEKTYGGTDWDMAYSIAIDKENNYVIAGETYSNSYGDADVYLIKTDTLGDTLWTKHYGGTGSDIAYSIDTTFHSGYLVAGVTRKATDTTYDAYLLKINSYGDTIWTRKYGDTLNDKFYCARQIDDSSYIVCGSTQNYGAIDYDRWILKYYTLGNQKWIRIDYTQDNQEFFDIKQNFTHDFITAGYSEAWSAGGPDATTALYNNDGWWVNGNHYGGLNNDYGHSINLTKDSCYILIGTTESFGLGISNIYFMKTDKNLLAAGNTIHETNISEIKSKQYFLFTTFPNPTTGIFRIIINMAIKEHLNLRVINILGKVLISESINSSNSVFSKTYNLSDFSDGIYYIIVTGENNLQTTAKLIKQSSEK